MDKKTFYIDGSNFSTLQGFYDEAVMVLTADFKEFGRNFDAFNDILRGGFGKFEYDEPIILRWKESAKSRVDLGYAETINYLREKIKKCHPSNHDGAQKDLSLAEKGIGQTLFEILIEIIAERKNIEFVLE
ncbi:MAG TPA: barstar family protein [Candidatus Omnitrophota bacterium]|nr:barstar family protein [Candidatus Omnitrophota bacterium]HPS36599.1 barstar family protein [Candidatus Omnitrophota bacterium]